MARDARFEMQQGMRSVLSYRADCPVEIHNERIEFHPERQKYHVELKLFSRKYVAEKGYPGTSMFFELYRLGGSQLTIVQRGVGGEYSIGECELVFNIKKRWSATG